MAFLSQQDMKDVYNSLPEDLQNAIFSPASMDFYNQIRDRYALDPAQREELSIQSGLLMMGITEPKEYVVVLSEKLGVPRDKAAFIAQEVNRNILHPVRESLKMVHQPVTGAPRQEIPRENPVPVVMPYPAAPIPSASVIMPSSSLEASSLDQKLGGTFRVPTPPQASVPNYSIPTPPVPQPIAPAPTSAPSVPPPPVPPAPPAPSTPRAGDPYREAVL